MWTLLHCPSNYERGACLSGRSIFELGSRPLQAMRGDFLRRVEMSDFLGLAAVVLVRSVSDSIELLHSWSPDLARFLVRSESDSIVLRGLWE